MFITLLLRLVYVRDHQDMCPVDEISRLTFYRASHGPHAEQTATLKLSVTNTRARFKIDMLYIFFEYGFRGAKNMRIRYMELQHVHTSTVRARGSVMVQRQSTIELLHGNDQGYHSVSCTCSVSAIFNDSP